MKHSRPKPDSAFTLVEVMISVAVGSLVMAALLTASIALQRSFAAVEGNAIAQGDQLRVQDYIAMDCRRATYGQIPTTSGTPLDAPKVDNGSWVNSGGTWKWASNASGPVTLILSVPNYYDTSGSPQAPTFPPDPNNPGQYLYRVKYADGSTSVSYYKSGSSFIREIVSTDASGNSTDSKVAIATNVASFTVTPADQSIMNDRTVSCKISFAPTFTRVASVGAIGGTTIYAQTFLRDAEAAKAAGDL